jgi:hypothetical protein
MKFKTVVMFTALVSSLSVLSADTGYCKVVADEINRISRKLKSLSNDFDFYKLQKDYEQMEKIRREINELASEQDKKSNYLQYNCE